MPLIHFTLCVHRPRSIQEKAAYIEARGGKFLSILIPDGLSFEIFYKGDPLVWRRPDNDRTSIEKAVNSLIEQAHEWFKDKERLEPVYGEKWEEYRF